MEDKNLRIGILVVVMVVALIVPIAEAAEKMQYRLKFEKGKKYYIKSVTKQQITQTMMGQEQKIDQTIGFGFNFDIEDVDDSGNAWVRHTYEWIKFEQKGPMGEVVYDSSKKKSPVSPAGQAFAVLLGEIFSMKMTPQGQVKEIKGLDEMYSNIQKKLPEGPMGEQIMQGLEQQFLNEETLKGQTEMIAVYPERAVGIGDSWSRKVVVPQVFVMIVETKCTLKERKGGVAIIEFDSTIKSDPEAGPMQMGNVTRYELSGTLQGFMEMQESTGNVTHSEFSQQLSGEIAVENPAEGPGEMIIPMEIRGTGTVDMTERKK